LVLVLPQSQSVFCALLYSELPLAAGFVLGAIVSPPDASAAMAIAAHLRLPHRIVSILEGEKPCE